MQHYNTLYHNQQYRYAVNPTSSYMLNESPSNYLSVNYTYNYFCCVDVAANYCIIC